MRRKDSRGREKIKAKERDREKETERKRQREKEREGKKNNVLLTTCITALPLPHSLLTTLMILELM